MILQTPHWGYPGWLSNECGNLFCNGLYRREDLDATRSARCKVLSLKKAS